jgi:hypothetical protein
MEESKTDDKICLSEELKVILKTLNEYNKIAKEFDERIKYQSLSDLEKRRLKIRRLKKEIRWRPIKKFLRIFQG